jgi:hypothetical protein
MSEEILLAEGEVGITVDSDTDLVLLSGHDAHSWIRGSVNLSLTPGQAVSLSRALVKAAAEALGVGV